MKTLLIHGYATKLHASIFRKPLPEHEGFIGLQNEIKNGEIDVFHWGIDRPLSFVQSINPFSYLTLYRDEERLAESLELQQKLFTMITSSGTKRIICHSMGCRLLLNMINAIGLPSSVRSIVFLQADIDADSELPTPISYSLENFFCPWDPSLITSSMLHWNLRVGLRAWKHKNVKNSFFPLLRPINLHISPLRNRRFAKFLLQDIQ
jgi:hypothetical protein